MHMDACVCVFILFMYSEYVYVYIWSVCNNICLHMHYILYTLHAIHYIGDQEFCAVEWHNQQE